MLRAGQAVWAVLSRRTRGLVAAGTLAATLGKLGVVVIAARLAAGDARGGVYGAVVLSALFAAQRAVTSLLRVAAECDAIRGLSSALLEGDVLKEPNPNAHGTVGDGAFEVPALAEAVVAASSGVLAGVLALPFVLPVLSSALVLGGSAGIVAVVGCTLAIRRGVVRRQAELSEMHRRVFDQAFRAIDGRLEIAARAAERRALGALELTLGAYERHARQMAWTTSLLGRAPIALGVMIAVAVAVLFADPGAALATLVGHALLLGAVAAPLMGSLLAVNDLVKRIVRLRPFVELLSWPRRPELDRAGVAPASPTTSFEAQALSFRYESDDPTVIDALDFVWSSGEPLLLVGRNGAGKSTLLKLLLGLRAPTAGSLRAGATDVGALDLASFRAEIAYLPQRPYLGEAYTPVREAIAFLVENVPDAEVLRALERVGLLETLKRRGSPLDVHVGELSAGQRQRLALARILLEPAKIVLLDEPDANLDRAGVALLSEIARELVARGTMVAIAAHDPALLALSARRVEL